MSGEDDEDTDKEHDASPQKLLEAREKGDIPRAPDLLMAAGIAGFLLGLFSLGNWAIERLGLAGMVLLDQSDTLSRLVTSAGSSAISSRSARSPTPRRSTHARSSA